MYLGLELSSGYISDYIIIISNLIMLGFADFIQNTLFFQSALCRQSAVETKSQNQGQSGTRQGQIGTRVGQIGTGEGQIGTGEGQLEISYRVLETWFSSINEVSI